MLHGNATRAKLCACALMDAHTSYSEYFEVPPQKWLYFLGALWACLEPRGTTSEVKDCSSTAACLSMLHGNATRAKLCVCPLMGAHTSHSEYFEVPSQKWLYFQGALRACLEP